VSPTSLAARDGCPQEAARRLLIRHLGEEGEEEVVAGDEETAGTSPASAGSAAVEEGGGRGSGARGTGVDREEGGWDGGEERDN
jgi:hypothetical protein